VKSANFFAIFFGENNVKNRNTGPRSRFYSCAIQYHEAGLKPMGLVVDERTGLMAIVKKSGISFVRPGESIYFSKGDQWYRSPLVFATDRYQYYYAY
jgi:hypothetical protein